MSIRRRSEDDLLDVRGVPDVRDQEWYRVASEIAELRIEGRYAWAEEPLAAMQRRIERTHRVTEGQRRAIARIRSSEWAPSRNYDAFGYRRRWR